MGNFTENYRENELRHCIWENLHILFFFGMNSGIALKFVLTGFTSLSFFLLAVSFMFMDDPL